MYSPKLYIIVIAISMCIYYTKKYINVYLHFALRRMIHKIRVDENAFMAEAIQAEMTQILIFQQVLRKEHESVTSRPCKIL